MCSDSWIAYVYACEHVPMYVSNVSMSVHVFESLSVHARICVCLQKSEVNSDVIPLSLLLWWW